MLLAAVLAIKNLSPALDLWGVDPPPLSLSLSLSLSWYCPDSPVWVLPSTRAPTQAPEDAMIRGCIVMARVSARQGPRR